LLGCSLFATGVYAHVTGVFKDFLVGVGDENSTEKLKTSLEETKKEIEELTPAVESMEKKYDNDQEDAVSKLLFYNTIGMDAYFTLLTNSSDAVDVLANQRLFEKKLDDDLQSLNSLYLTYMQLKTAKESLEGHVELLHMIEKNLKARDVFLKENSVPRYTKEQNAIFLTNIAQVIWENDAAKVDEVLLDDAKKLANNPDKYFTREEQSYKLDEKKVNKDMKATYFFRSDHIYVHFHQGEADIILIGLYGKNSQGYPQLHFEAGFMNGIMLPSNLLDPITSFQINFEKNLVVKQGNGYTSFVPEKYSGI
jgi:hypothetical protein